MGDLSWKRSIKSRCIKIVHGKHILQANQKIMDVNKRYFLTQRPKERPMQEPEEGIAATESERESIPQHIHCLQNRLLE